MNTKNQTPRKSLYWIVLLAIFLASFGGGKLSSVRAEETRPATQTETSTQPAHYIVFEKRSDGSITPVYYQSVELAAPLESISDSQIADALAQPSRNVELVFVSLHDNHGKVVYQNIVQVSPWLRGEFHGAKAGDPIDGHILPAENSAFVVRVPIIEGTSLMLKDAHGTTMAQFDLARLTSETPRPALDLGMVAEPRSVTGPAANRVDLLIMGDGYRASQSAQFDIDATNVANQFFSISPYAEYKNYFNIYNLFNASTHSGADHPPYSSSCGYGDPTCCGDPEMQIDPLQGQMVNTVFDARFCANWIHRLLVVDSSKVLAAAAAIPDWDTILMIVNDTTYGGSGGFISVFSMHSAAVEVAQHEFGHSFINLADEYDSPYPGYPACSDVSGPACESNVTDVTNRSQIKWNPWILPTTPIPTPETFTYDNMVGLFEGARYLTTGMYRPGLYCIMQSLGAPFCQVPSQSYVLKLYNGGWGVPGNGINLIEPGSNTPTSSIVMLTHPATQAFHADILSPIGGPPVQIVWLKNGVPIPGESGNTFTYTTNTSDPVLTQITMRVRDTTSLVNPAMAGSALRDEFTWNVIRDAQVLRLNSIGARDGWIIESTEFSNTGRLLDATTATFSLGDAIGDRQYRSILSFNTQSLPDNAVIFRVTLKIRKQGLEGTDPFTTHGNLLVDVRKGFFGSSANLKLTDFNATASKNNIGGISNTPVSNWYTKIWNSGIFPYINLTGVTQLRLRFGLDDNDDMSADVIRFFSGDYATASARPRLIIEYYVP